VNWLQVQRRRRERRELQTASAPPVDSWIAAKTDDPSTGATGADFDESDESDETGDAALWAATLALVRVSAWDATRPTMLLNRFS